MGAEIVGRDGELAALEAFLERPAARSAALVLTGAPGIGKSTLWLAGVEAAHEQGLRVLTARPAEAERQLAHAGLADLLDGASEEVLPELTAPQRRALGVALLLEDAGDEAPDPRALGAGVRAGLRLLAERRPVLIAVDDVQWLDNASAAALDFALRRLDDAPVRLLLTRRGGAASVERALDRDRLDEVRVGPLSAGAVHALLRRRLGRTFPRPALMRLHAASGGNPFYALELARALDRRGGTVDPSEPLPVPETLHELVRDRLETLPPETRAALLAVAALPDPRFAVLRALDLAAPEVLEAAVRADVLEVSGDEVRFAHPLLASVLYAEAPAEERRALHSRLAEVVADPVERARHLGLSAVDPDEGTASLLESGARLAAARGAPGTAAELAEQAARLTPANRRAAAERRSQVAARGYLAAGEAHRARELARGLVAGARTGAPRAEALRLLAEVEGDAGDVRQEIRLLRQALEHAAEAPALQAAIHLSLGRDVRITEGLGAAEHHAHAALELAERAGDRPLRARALSVLGLLRFNAGRPDALRLAEQAYELDAGVAVTTNLAHVLLWSCEFARARTLLEDLHGQWRERDEGVSANALWYLAFVELRSGRWSLATEYAARVEELYRHYALDQREPSSALIAPVNVLAHRGELAAARELAEQGRETAEGQPALRMQYEGILGCIELWRGNPAEAAERFAAAERDGRTAELVEPTFYDWRAEEVEALLQLERLDEAEELVDAWEAVAGRLGREWVLAKTTRCRGLVAAARGEVADAVVLLEAALARHEAVGDPFGRSRALFALGVTRRRSRQKRAAREAIEAALAGFEELGAAWWAEAARAELGRIGGRTRAAGLTAAEQRVAALVAEGRTNREVAAVLFLGERTVETHLSHVYAKLGIRSRTELARTLR